ncbi:hypothetical protein [Actinomadura macrotermitis]|uniref:DUF5666 domain-containing protein n=1 Tax=Actinomadura macrotermitis TaxID=2585200 RepID=A0A7K0BYB1_9ACTN|nr:hypothetical protein [Actinomadura macrotermitis]MQY06076.1 hypothetical protein [Actinomadura macrotermitis]
MSDHRKEIRVDDAELLATSPFEGDLATELAAAPPARPGPALYLGGALLAVAGFIGGIWADKSMSDGESTPQPQRAAGGYAGGGYGGFRGGAPGGSAPAGMTFGTVTKVEKGVLYLTTADGKTVKVSTSGQTAIRVTKKGTLKDLGAGTTVTVQGEAGDDGTIAATIVSQGAGRGQRP